MVFGISSGGQRPGASKLALAGGQRRSRRPPARTGPRPAIPIRRGQAGARTSILAMNAETGTVVGSRPEASPVEDHRHQRAITPAPARTGRRRRFRLPPSGLALKTKPSSFRTSATVAGFSPRSATARLRKRGGGSGSPPSGRREDANTGDGWFAAVRLPRGDVNTGDGRWPSAPVAARPRPSPSRAKGQPRCECRITSLRPPGPTRWPLLKPATQARSNGPPSSYCAVVSLLCDVE